MPDVGDIQATIDGLRRLRYLLDIAKADASTGWAVSAGFDTHHDKQGVQFKFESSIGVIAYQLKQWNHSRLFQPGEVERCSMGAYICITADRVTSVRTRLKYADVAGIIQDITRIIAIYSVDRESERRQEELSEIRWHARVIGLNKCWDCVVLTVEFLTRLQKLRQTQTA